MNAAGKKAESSKVSQQGAAIKIAKKPVQLSKQQQQQQQQKRSEPPRRQSVGARVVGKRIKVYRNGDVFFKGIRVVINTKQISSVQAFLDVITEKIGLTHGAKKLYTLNGELIRSMDQIQNDKEYVAATNVFTPLPYGQTKLTATANGSLRTDSSGSSTAKPIKVSLRASRSVDPKKEKSKESGPHKRSGSSVPPARNKPSAENDTPKTKKKSKKSGNTTAAVIKDLPEQHPTAAASTSTSSSSASTTKRLKTTKKKVKVDRNPSVILAAPPEFLQTADEGQRSSSPKPVAGRAPTPIPVAEIRESENENGATDDQSSNKSGKVDEASEPVSPSSPTIVTTTASEENPKSPQRFENTAKSTSTDDEKSKENDEEQKEQEESSKTKAEH